MPFLKPHLDARALVAGPWCWPAPGVRLTSLLTRHGAMPEAPVGAIAALTVQEDGTIALWCIRHGRHGRHDDGGATLGPVMRRSWRDVGVALPRGLPVLWDSMHSATATLPQVTYLASVRDAPGVPSLHQPVDGSSFGLAFILSLASTVLGCALPGDLVASAAVDATGAVGPVGGLARKIAGLRTMAPHVTRVLVAASQVEEAVAAAGDTLRVVAVAHASEAIEVAFGDRLSQLVVQAGEDPQRRAELTESFFRLALMGSDALVDWAPVMRGATLALDRWTDLSPAAHYRLAFAQAVAARHHQNGGTIGMPPEGWLDALPRMVRVQVVAHLVQQSADAGTPAPAVVEPQAARLVDHALAESSAAELRLRGALARLLAVTGRPQDALQMQEQLAAAFAAIYADTDIAYPLSEWARLAGALGDAASLDRAQAFHARLLGEGGYRRLGPRFVELALARGRLMIDPDDAEAVQLARQLAEDDALPDHVRWCARRWLGAAGRPALQAAALHGHVVAARNLELLQLDEALRTGAADAAAACVDALESYDPGPVGHLRRAGATPGDIARLYPY